MRGGAGLIPALCAALFAQSSALAEGAPDLRVEEPPVVVEDLAMRPGQAEEPDTQVAAAEPPREAAPGARLEPVASTEYEMLPGSVRDLEERVLFKLNVGYGLDSAPLSGAPMQTGFAPGDVTDPRGKAFTETRQYALGDAAVGTSGILMPSLSTYFLSRFRFDTEGASAFTGAQSVYDESDGRDLLIHAAYAEVDGIGEGDGPASRVHLRAGRQFRYGATMYVANFDGVTAAYDDPGFELSGFFGRRVSLFFRDDPGVLGGAGAVLRGQELVGLPVDLRTDYLFFDGAGGGDLDGDGQSDVSASRQFVESRARVKLGQSRVFLRGRFVDPGELSGEGAGLGRVGAQVRYSLSRSTLFVLDTDHRRPREVAYDFISPVPVDVVDVSRRLGIGLDPPEAATRMDLRAHQRLGRKLETYGAVRRNQIHGDTDSGFNVAWWEWALAASARLTTKLTASAQVKQRRHELEADSNQPGSAFDDTAGSGVSDFSEYSAEARYSRGARAATASLGGYVRVYDFRSPYAEVATDARAGGRLDVDYWVGERTRLKAAGELAQASPTFAAELGTLASVRLLAEVTF